MSPAQTQGLRGPAAGDQGVEGDADDDAGQHEGHGHHPAQQVASGEGAPVEDEGAGDAEGHAHGGAQYRLGEGLREDPPGALAGQDLAEAAQVQGAVGGEAAVGSDCGGDVCPC